jgi:hypothetical protein
MVITSGTRLGSYEIFSAPGAGNMATGVHGDRDTLVS